MIIDFTQSRTELRINERYIVLSDPEGDRVSSFRQDITVLPADDPRKLKLGWTIREEIGIVIVNDYGISRISDDS